MAIHPTAVIDPRAEIHETAQIGPYCVIDANVRVGPRCRVFQNVYLSGWTEIGDDCVLHPHVIVGHEPQDIKYQGQRSYCRIGNGTILREFATIHRGTEPDSSTVVGANCFLLGGSHVAHNCVLGDQVTLINNVLLAGHVHVGDRATLGGAAVVHQFVRIGELAMIPGNGRVPLDVPPFALLDLRGRVAGLNRVGIRRAGLNRDDAVEIRELYRALYDGSVSHAVRLENMSKRASSATGKRFTSFVLAMSKRGLAGRSRSDWRGPVGEPA